MSGVWFLWTWDKQELSSLLRVLMGSIVRPLNSFWPHKYSVPGIIASRMGPQDHFFVVLNFPRLLSPESTKQQGYNKF